MLYEAISCFMQTYTPERTIQLQRITMTVYGGVFVVRCSSGLIRTDRAVTFSHGAAAECRSHVKSRWGKSIRATGWRCSKFTFGHIRIGRRCVDPGVGGSSREKPRRHTLQETEKDGSDCCCCGSGLPSENTLSSSFVFLLVERAHGWPRRRGASKHGTLQRREKFLKMASGLLWRWWRAGWRWARSLDQVQPDRDRQL